MFHCAEVRFWGLPHFRWRVFWSSWRSREVCKRDTRTAWVGNLCRRCGRCGTERVSDHLRRMCKWGTREGPEVDEVECFRQRISDLHRTVSFLRCFLGGSPRLLFWNRFLIVGIALTVLRGLTPEFEVMTSTSEFRMLIYLLRNYDYEIQSPKFTKNNFEKLRNPSRHQSILKYLFKL